MNDIFSWPGANSVLFSLSFPVFAIRMSPQPLTLQLTGQIHLPIKVSHFQSQWSAGTSCLCFYLSTNRIGFALTCLVGFCMSCVCPIFRFWCRGCPFIVKDVRGGHLRLVLPPSCQWFLKKYSKLITFILPSQALLFANLLLLCHKNITFQREFKKKS